MRESQLLKWLSHVTNWLDRTPAGRKVDAELARLNIPLRGGEFVLIQVICVMVVALAVFETKGALLAILVSPLAFLLPHMPLRRYKLKRYRTFTLQLPDLLSIITTSLRAGHSFAQCLYVAAKHLEPPAVEEVQRMLAEMQLGQSLDEALEGLADRVPTDEVELFVTAVQIQREVGGNVVELLETISGLVRERIQLEGELRAITAQGRISSWIITALPVVTGVALSLINPSYMGLLIHTPLGKSLLLVAVCSAVLGFWLIRRMVKITG